jgi:hypothetical protein
MLWRPKRIRRNMSLCDGSSDKMKEIDLHLADLLIKGGVNIKEKKKEVICAYVKLENASGL